MIKRLYNIWFKQKTKNFTRIPVFVMTFDWNKFLKEKLSGCVDYIRDNYDMETFTKIYGR